MNFLRNIFGGGGGGNTGSSGDQRGFYVYVRPKMCKELVEVRIDTMNDLSGEDHGDGFFVRKTARAIRCPFPVEMTLHFDKNRNFLSGEIENGEFVTSQDYAAWLAEKEAKTEDE